MPVKKRKQKGNKSLIPNTSIFVLKYDIVCKLLRYLGVVYAYKQRRY